MIKTQKKKDQLEEGYKLDANGQIVPDYDTTIKCFDEGDILKGSVVQIDRYEVLVDVGYKSEGVIPLKELSVKSSTNPKDVVKIGEEIETVVLQKEDSEGRLILSKKRADFEKAWDDIEKASKEGTIVRGRVIEVVRGGLILNIGVRGFLPASLVDINRVKNLEEYRNQELECKIIELNRNRNNVVLSRKAALSNDRRTSKHELLEKLKIGQIVKGTVSSIVDFGAFVDLGGTDGLIHISEMSWEHINHPSEVLSVSQDIEVQVLDIDTKKARVSLGLKQTQDDPWKEKVKDYKIDRKIKGKVSKILPFGVFIDFDEGLEGLIHISELAPGRVVNANEIVEVGQEVEAKIIAIDVSRRRISLSVKQLKQVSDVRRQTLEKKDKEEEKPRAQKEEKAEEKTTKETKAEEKAAQKATAEKVENKAEAEEPKVEEEKQKAEESDSATVPAGRQEATPDKPDKEEEEKAAIEDGVKEAQKKEVEKLTVDSRQSTNETETVQKKKKKKDSKEPEEQDEETEKAKVVNRQPSTVNKPKQNKKPLASEDEALLEKLTQGPTKIEDEKVEELPEPSSLEDVLEQMKKSHGAKK